MRHPESALILEINSKEPFAQMLYLMNLEKYTPYLHYRNANMLTGSPQLSKYTC